MRLMNLHREPLLEVRCCCEPIKLLGYLPYPTLFGDEPARGQRVMFPVPGPDGGTTRLVLTIEAITGNVVSLERVFGLDCYELTLSGEYLAYKSDDTPPEVLRTVPLWIAAPAALLRFQSTRGEEVMVLAPGEVARAQAVLTAQGAYVCPHCRGVSPNGLATQACEWCRRVERW